MCDKWLRDLEKLEADQLRRLGRQEMPLPPGSCDDEDEVGQDLVYRHKVKMKTEGWGVKSQPNFFESAPVASAALRVPLPGVMLEPESSNNLRPPSPAEVAAPMSEIYSLFRVPLPPSEREMRAGLPPGISIFAPAESDVHRPSVVTTTHTEKQITSASIDSQKDISSELSGIHVGGQKSWWGARIFGTPMRALRTSGAATAHPSSSERQHSFVSDGGPGHESRGSGLDEGMEAPQTPGWLQAKKGRNTVKVWDANAESSSNAIIAIKRVLQFFGVQDRVQRRGSAILTEIQAGRKKSEENFFYKIVHSIIFQSICYMVVFANAIFIGVSAQVSLTTSLTGEPAGEAVKRLDLVFLSWFSFELIFRLLGERLHFFIGTFWGWNLLDLFLVITSIIDMAAESVGGLNTTSARIIRLARFVRLFRMCYAIKAFTSLRVIVLGIMDSSVSLFWCFCIVGFIIYVFAVFFVQCVTEHFLDHRADSIDHVSLDLKLYYGSMKVSMVTLFQVISGGLDWNNAMDPLMQVHWVYQFVFLFYVFFMFFAVLNVVIGTFVATTSEIQTKDRDTQVKMQMKSFERYAAKLKGFFIEADTDGSGRLSWEEFETHLQNPSVKAYFHALELDVSSADALFRILDADGSGEVGVSEFVEGCMWLKNQAKSLDIKMLMYQNEMVFARLNKFIQYAEDRLGFIENQLHRMQLTAD